jgi:hypothetical protein
MLARNGSQRITPGTSLSAINHELGEAGHLRRRTPGMITGYE